MLLNKQFTTAHQAQTKLDHMSTDYTTETYTMPGKEKKADIQLH